MAWRAGRSDLPTDPTGTIRALSACRGAMVDVLRTVKPMGPAYHAASMLVSAIDGSSPEAPKREASRRGDKEAPPCA